MEENIYEINDASCGYCKQIYYENDTGYTQYGCSLITGNAKDYECFGGSIDYGCPLSFKYKIQKN